MHSWRWSTTLLRNNRRVDGGFRSWAPGNPALASMVPGTPDRYPDPPPRLGGQMGVTSFVCEHAVCRADRSSGSLSTMDRFEKLKVLGRGAFAVAYLVRDKTTGEQLVVKRFNVPMDALTASEKAEALNEVGLLASLRHDHIIGYREHFEDANILHIVMECVSLVWVTPGVQQPTHLALCVCVQVCPRW